MTTTTTAIIIIGAEDKRRVILLLPARRIFRLAACGFVLIPIRPSLTRCAARDARMRVRSACP